MAGHYFFLVRVVLHTWRLKVDVKVESADVRRILTGMQEAGWKPALILSEQHFAELAGVNPEFPVRMKPEDSFLPWRTDPTDLGEVFFADDGVYYVRFDSGERRGFITVIDPYEKDHDPEEPGSEIGPGIEVGVISDEQQNIDGRLHKFATDLQSAILDKLDGRKTRYMKLDWSHPRPKKSRISLLTEQRDDDEGVKFINASLDSETVTACTALVKPISRKVLVELSQVGFARKMDVLGRRGRNKDEIEAVLRELVKSGLLTKEFLLECREFGSPITKIDDPKKMETSEIGQLICPNCSRKFKEEVLTEAFSLSDLGHRLIKGNHWLTVWVTDLLCVLGVPLENILWNALDGGEEIDIVVEFLEEFWIFELKGREFGAGDAHPFNYRVVRFKADKAVILTTEKVSKDARKVFADLERQVRDAWKVTPMFIEGLGSAKKILENEISLSATRYACRRVRDFNLAAGFDISGLVVARFGLEPPN